jgi:tryptophan synthase beta chain
MHTLGHSFVPPSIHAGGLRYHGAAPLLSQLVSESVVEAIAYGQTSVFEAAVQFARTEGIVPAPESSHAIRATIDEAQRARQAGERRVILFNLSGHGHFDMGAYDAYLSGTLQDYAYPAEAIQQALTELPKVALPA